MSRRPLPLSPTHAPAHAALADVLEPGDDDPTGALAPSLAQRRPSQRPRPAPVSIRAPLQVHDFAFADTVFAEEPSEPAPPSVREVAPHAVPIFFDEVPAVEPPRPSAQCLTPLAFPLPDAVADAALGTRLRVGAAHVRHGLRGARDEMRELWAGTLEIVEEQRNARGLPALPSAFALFVHRVLALWSCFQWSGADLTRAALIAAGVLLVAGVAFATTQADGPSDAGRDAGSGAAARVRVVRTLEQHTGRALVMRKHR